MLIITYLRQEKILLKAVSHQSRHLTKQKTCSNFAPPTGQCQKKIETYKALDKREYLMIIFLISH